MSDPNQSSSPDCAPLRSIYEEVTAERFWTLARCFYARIEKDALLRPMFPADLEEPIRNQAEFLIQYFGGPQEYSQRKGHPRLRMRHHPFKIGLAQRNAWVACMEGAMDDASIPPRVRTAMSQYFANTATFLMNSVE